MRLWGLLSTPKGKKEKKRIKRKEKNLKKERKGKINTLKSRLHGLGLQRGSVTC